MKVLQRTQNMLMIKMTGGTPEEHSDKSLTITTMDQWTSKPIDQCPMEQWTIGSMDQWTNGPMDPWTNGPMIQWTNGHSTLSCDSCDIIKSHKC